MSATRESPLPWVPHLERCEGQSIESHQEQVKSLQIGTRRILLHKQGKLEKNLSIVGPPGSGKTLITQLLGIFAVSQGLNVLSTSLAAEQSRMSGGVHMHVLFHIRANKTRYSHPLHAASDCIRNLSKNELSCILLKQADIIFFEELGVVSAELYSVPDTAMKHLMNNDMKMGGKLVISNGDPFQLQAINGRSMWLSTHFLFQYDVLLLEHYVRSRSDPKLQELLTLLRKIDHTEVDIDHVTSIMCENCNFVDNWNEVPSHAIRIVPKRKAAAQVTRDYLRERAQNSNVRTVVSHSMDQCQIGDQWVPLGNANHVKTLDKVINEVKELTIYEGSANFPEPALLSRST